ncbi:spermatogenesis-associated protein 2 [Synchiropus picturatus]
MRDSSAEASRGDLFQEYVRWGLELRTEAQPCRDDTLFTRVRTFLLGKGATDSADGVFDILPFHQALAEGAEEPNWTRHLSRFIKATELLEVLCVNLFLQPWRKEFKTLKCFTGAFVYHLKPVFSSPTLQLVLARIGYLPDPDSSLSQYRLSADVDTDQTMQMGFELMLARAQCLHHMELLESNQLSAEESIDLLQRRTTGLKTHVQSEDRSQYQREDSDEGAAEKLRSLYVRPRLNTSQHGYHLSAVDQSIMEMQKNYPDLAIRGRPILPEKPQLPPPYLKRKDEGAAPPTGAGSTSNTDDGGGTESRDRRTGRSQRVQGGSRTEATQDDAPDIGAAGQRLEDTTQGVNKEDESQVEVEEKQEEEELFDDQCYVLL